MRDIPGAVIKNESGFALITVLAFSVILMVIMITLLNTNLIEILLSGTSTTTKQALTAADAGVEYTRGTFAFYSSVDPGYTKIDYTTQAKNGVPSPLKERITFVNISAMGSVSGTLGSGYGLSQNVRFYRSKIRSSASSGLSRKTVEITGYRIGY